MVWQQTMDVIPRNPVMVAHAAVFEQIDHGLIVLDQQNRVVDINPAAQRIIGHRASAAIGRPLARVLADHPALLAHCYDQTEACTELAVESGEHFLHLALRVSPLVDPPDRPVGRLIVLRDITERRQLREELRTAQDELRQRLAEQTFIYVANAYISSSLDLQSVLGHIAEQLGQAVEATSAYICRLDLHALKATVLAEYFGPFASTKERISDLGLTYEEDVQYIKKLQAGEFTIDHVDDPELRESARSHMLEYGAKTVLCIPLRASNHLIGYVELWDSHQKREFLPEEISLCQAISYNAASAIENARLYQQLQEELAERVHAETAWRRAEGEVRKQLQEQAALRTATEVIASSLNLTNVLTYLGETMCQAVDGTSAYVLTWEPETHTSTMVAEYLSPQTSEKERDSDLGVSYVVNDHRFLKALASGQPWVDWAVDPDLPNSEQEQSLRFRAKTTLYIPLRVRDQIMGFAELWETRRTREFHPDEIAFCQAVAQNAAIAIEHARLFQQMQQELAEKDQIAQALRQLNQELENRIAQRTDELTRINAEMVQEITDRKQAETQLIQRNRELLSLQSAISATASSLDLPFVLETVTWEMVSLLGANDCLIAEWDPDTHSAAVLAQYGAAGSWDEGPSRKTYHLADYPFKTRVLDERCAQQISISQADPQTGEFVDMQTQHAKTLLLLPMVFQTRVVGFVELQDNRDEHTFTDNEISLAQLLANQAAAAIENARLYAETQRRLREQTALREAGAAISSAIDPETVLKHMAEQMGRAVDATSAYICGLDVAAMRFTVLAEYIGANASAPETQSDLGISYDTSDAEFMAMMESGRYDVSHIDDPNLSEIDRKHMQQFGAKTILYVPLLVRGQLGGFAELWESRRHRVFSPDEISLCHGIAQQAAIALENARLYEQARNEIAERRRVEEQIKASLKEKEVLLQEIHHRVKNNLQVVSSLLNLQSRGIEDRATLEMFQESQNRILSMALIHEKLYRSSDLSKIDLAGYLRSLTTDLMHSYRAKSGPVGLKMNAQDVFLSIDKAVPCGLIVNELISNALKHAFPSDNGQSAWQFNGKENEISITLSIDPEGTARLAVGDNGIGFPEDLDIESLDSLGLRLINTLISQLEGTLEVENNDGTQFILTFAA